jgi:hypothetical protein
LVLVFLVLVVSYPLDNTRGDSLANLNTLLQDQWLPDINMGLVNNTVDAWVYHGTDGYVQIIRNGNVEFQVPDAWPDTTLELKYTAHLTLSMTAALSYVLLSEDGKLDALSIYRMKTIQEAIRSHSWNDTVLSAQQILYCEDIQHKTSQFISDLLDRGRVELWEVKQYMTSVNESLQLIMLDAGNDLIQREVDMYTTVLNNLTLEERENIYVLIEAGHMVRVGLTSVQAAEMVFKVDYQDTLIVKETYTDSPTNEIGEHIRDGEIGKLLFGYFSSMHHDLFAKIAKDYLFNKYGYIVKYPI